jgi:ATP-dependent RNA helicase RhlB
MEFDWNSVAGAGPPAFSSKGGTGRLARSAGEHTRRERIDPLSTIFEPAFLQFARPPRAVSGQMSDTHLSEVSFTQLHLPEPLARGIADAGFERCTPIQAQTLPRALAGFDIAGQAQTGTGKTAAFLVALYSKLLREEPPAGRQVNHPRALIIAPTRELAVQIHKDAEILGQYTGLTLGLAFGGVDYDKQRRILQEGVDILIGTPGRLIDFYKQRVFDLRSVQVVVLDEADRMFDLGFIADIRYIMRRLPPPDQRLNLLFSATLAQRVLELAFEHMNDPELTRIEPDKMTVDRVRQVIYYPSMEEKPRLLVGLLRQMDPHRTMVFVNTRRGADELEALLKANGFNAEAISGDVPQNKRLRMIRDFLSGDLAILIGTDVASRGLHIPDVSHVFNYDLPQDPADYVHRIGRTARAGAEGDAISLGCEDYVQSLPDIEDYIGRKIPVASVAQELLAEITVPRHERRRFGGPGSGPRHGGGRGGPRGGRDGGRGGPRREHRPSSPRPAPAKPTESAEPSAQPSAAPTGEAAGSSPQPAAAGEGEKKKRRRRGGRGRGRKPGADQAGGAAPESGGPASTES